MAFCKAVPGCRRRRPQTAPSGYPRQALSSGPQTRAAEESPRSPQPQTVGSPLPTARRILGALRAGPQPRLPHCNVIWESEY